MPLGTVHFVAIPVCKQTTVETPPRTLGAEHLDTVALPARALDGEATAANPPVSTHTTPRETHRLNLTPMTPPWVSAHPDYPCVQGDVGESRCAPLIIPHFRQIQPQSGLGQGPRSAKVTRLFRSAG